MTRSVARLNMEALEPRLAQVLAPRVARLGYLGEFFQCAGHQPQALVAFIEFGEALKKALPESLSEVVALTIAGVTGSAYERNQHERLCLKLGFSRAWIAQVNRLDPDASELKADERSVQKLALAMAERRGRGTRDELERVIEVIGAAAAIAVLLLAGRCVTHAMVVSALELAPPVQSIFESAES